MKAFQYATALSVSSAQQLVADDGRYLAGGLDLLGEMKEFLVTPSLLVNIKSLPGLKQIAPGENNWNIGANVTVAQIEDHAGLRKVFPALHEAAADVGSRHVRNVATLGGNLAQHSRCWYYRHRDIPCLKKGGSDCYARKANCKYHSVASGNSCLSPVVSNLAIALGALNAVVMVQRAGQQVRMSIPELYAKAWTEPTAHHSLLPGDLILTVEIPAAPMRSAYEQISEKSAFDWALASCAVAAKMEGNQISQARILVGAVTPVPLETPAANQFLEGKILDETVATAAAELFLKEARPPAPVAYKITLARALIKRTLLKLKG